MKDCNAIPLQMKNYNTILTKMQQNDQHYHQTKLINMTISNTSKYSLVSILLRDMCKRRLSINEVYEEKRILYNEIKKAKYGRTPDEKINIFRNLEFIFNERGKFLILLKVIFFQ